MGDIYSDLLIRIRLQDNTSEAYSVEAQLDDGTAGYSTASYVSTTID